MRSRQNPGKGKGDNGMRIGRGGQEKTRAFQKTPKKKQRETIISEGGEMDGAGKKDRSWSVANAGDVERG